jgi:class 3 adenylate cyclase/tetratricopeptide (TPR) repeat protein
VPSSPTDPPNPSVSGVPAESPPVEADTPPPGISGSPGLPPVNCDQCNEENPGRARFCWNCGSPITRAADTHELRKTITVVFTDVVGSTGLGQRLDPEVLRRVMTRYYEHATAIHQRHGGKVQKFIGDAVMAVFGLPTVREDDALRAVRAAHELHTSLADLNASLERDYQVSLGLRTGVNTGEVVIGRSIGGQDITLGDVVNVAARLETTAEPGTVLMGDATYRLTRDAVTADVLPPMTVRGRGLPVDAWRLVAVKPGAAGHARRVDTPLVGRARELTLLRQILDRTIAEHTSHVVTLIGTGGAGTSRLLYEVLGQFQPQATVLRGQCVSYGDGLTYWPIAEAVRQAVGADPAADADEVHRRLTALLPGQDTSVAALDILFGPPGASGDASVELLPDALCRLARTLATDRPLVIVLDDLQWAEPALLDLVSLLGEWLRDAPVLICCLARPELLELRPGWGGGTINASSLLLEPLSPAEAAVLLDNLLGGAEGAEEVRARLITAAEGNPLYLEEHVGMVLDDGLLTQVDGKWVATAEPETLSVPPTIAALLAARLDALPPIERAVVERASVLGNVFFRDAIAALSPPDQRAQLTGALLGLVRKELLRTEPSALRGETALRFRHQLVRDAAYNALSKRERADLHETAADWLAENMAERMPELEEIVGYHLEQASRYRTGLGPVDADTSDLARRGAEHLGRAGRRAFARRDMPAAVTLLGRAIALLPADHSVRVGLLPQLGAALVERGEFTRAAEVLAEANGAADRTGDSELRVETEKVQSVLRLLSGPLTDTTGTTGALPDLTTTLQLGVEGGSVAANWTLLRDVRWLPRAGRRSSTKPSTSGTGGVVPAPGEKAAGRAKATGRSGASGTGVARVPAKPTGSASVGRAAQPGGQAAPAEDAQGRAITKAFALAAVLGDAPVAETISQYHDELAANRGNPTSELRLRGAMAGLIAMEGRFDDARAQLNSALAITDQLGLRVRAVALAYLGGYVELLAGTPVAAEDRLAKGATECERMGEQYLLSNLLALRAQALYALGRWDEAERLAAVAERTAPRDEIVALATARSARGKALARLGRVAPAVTAARGAVESVHGLGLSTVEADALLDLAEVLEVLRDPIGARISASEALGLYDRKGNIVSAARCRATIARVGG